MTAADYATIRERLDHPQVVVWELCAVTLAPDDPEWPAPGSWSDVEPLCAPFPSGVRARWGVEAATSVLPLWEVCCVDDCGPRQALELSIGWLCGEAVDRFPMSVDADQVAFIGDAAAGSAGVSIASAAAFVLGGCGTHGFESRLHASNASLRIWNVAGGGTALEALGQAVNFAVEAGVGRAMERVPLVEWDRVSGGCLESRFRCWWARCRAVLPIADVTTAEIEWGDIELPPRPIDGDLPGDGSES